MIHACSARSNLASSKPEHLYTLPSGITVTSQAVRCQLLAVSRSSRHFLVCWQCCRRKPSPACRQQRKIPMTTSSDSVLQYLLAGFMFRVCGRDATATALSSAMQGTPTNKVSSTRIGGRGEADIVLALMWRSTSRSLDKLLLETIVNHATHDRVRALPPMVGNLDVKPLPPPDPHTNIPEHSPCRQPQIGSDARARTVTGHSPPPVLVRAADLSHK